VEDWEPFLGNGRKQTSYRSLLPDVCISWFLGRKLVSVNQQTVSETLGGFRLLISRGCSVDIAVAVAVNNRPTQETASLELQMTGRYRQRNSGD
jgi:hypothetical protein